jgi:hypothetical protein
MQAIRQKMSGGGGGGGGSSRSAGLGAPQAQGPRGGGMSPYEQELEQRNRSQRDFKTQREQDRIRKSDERSFIQQLLGDYRKSMSSGNNKGDTGYTEQIFNNAGAPQVVKLNYQKPNESAAMEQDAILKLIMGAMR